MSKRDVTAEIVEKVLLTAATGATIATSLALPGAIVALGPIIEGAYDLHDKRQQNREYRRVLAYMKHQQLLKLEPRSGNGLIIAKRGRERLKATSLERLVVAPPQTWDSRWRLVMFDIPEVKRSNRRQFVGQLNILGFYQLQRSVWIHPFPCRNIVTRLATTYGVSDYITFVPAAKLDNEKALRQQFRSILKQVKT